ncbi:hypothetical protein [Moorena bouillonii]|uniref:hypothetical protein n=1 Tax=Moorena bouillonii TaxID=207920 RepID=UPI00096A874E|nr:hypothetical protein [Moorena bouillonii]
MGRWGDREIGRWGRWGDREMGRWGDGEMGRWGDRTDDIKSKREKTDQLSRRALWQNGNRREKSTITIK